jgi:hypothetical protein
MRQIYARIHRGGRALAEHPLFSEWLGDDARNPREKLLFAPMAIDYVMGFRDFCAYYVAYPAPMNALEEALTIHAAEDACHSALFLEDWAALGINAHFNFTPERLFAWMNGPETAPARAADYALTKLAAENPDPRFRFAIIEAMEVAGQVFFRRTVPVVDALVAAGLLASENALRYFGRHHLDREDGHLQHADETIFFRETFTDAERSHAEGLVDAVFAIFTTHFDLWLAFARRHVVEQKELSVPTPAPIESHILFQKESQGLDLPPHPARASGSTGAAGGDLSALKTHPFLTALAKLPAREALAFLYRQWAVDLFAWGDYFALDLGAAPPATRALALEIARENTACVAEWHALGLTATTGFSGVDALRHYWLAPQVEEHRRLFAELRKRTFRAEPEEFSELLRGVYLVGDPLRAAVRALLARDGIPASAHPFLAGFGAAFHRSSVPVPTTADQGTPDGELWNFLVSLEKARFDASLAALPGALTGALLGAAASLPSAQRSVA